MKIKATRGSPPPRRSLDRPTNGSFSHDDIDEFSEELTKESSDSEMFDVTHTGAFDTESDYIDIMDLD